MPEHVDRPRKGSTVAESMNDTVARAHPIATEVRGGVVVDPQYLDVARSQSARLGSTERGCISGTPQMVNIAR